MEPSYTQKQIFKTGAVEGTSSFQQSAILPLISQNNDFEEVQAPRKRNSRSRPAAKQFQKEEAPLARSLTRRSKIASSSSEQSTQLKKTYACKHCDYSSVKSDHLKRHNEMKHNTDHVNTFFCEICRVDGVVKSFPWKYELNRHVKSHTGASRPLISGEKVTWKPRTAEMLRARAKHLPEQGKEKEYHDIRLLALSYPGTIRHSGGYISKGPLAGTTVSGMPEIFNTQGKLRDKYHFLHEGVKEMRKKRAKDGSTDEPTPADAATAPAPRARPSRRCKPKPAIPLPSAHASVLRRRAQTVAHSPTSTQTMLPASNTPLRSDFFTNRRPFTELKEPLYFPSEFSARRRPSYWPKGWSYPQNPTHIPHDETQCELCNARICDCIEKVLANTVVPQIEHVGQGKGEGLRATTAYGARGGKLRRPGSSAAPEVVYAKGDFLGQLTGKLVPVGSVQSHGYLLELKRDDLDGLPILAWVDMLDWGNFVRKANHTCSGAATAFANHRISGRYRIMLVALRDILEGEEVTVNYGRAYWESDGGKCLCGSEDCVSKE